VSKHETPTQLLDCGNAPVVAVTRQGVLHRHAVPFVPRQDAALPVRGYNRQGQSAGDRVHSAEKSAVANRLRILLSRQLQSMGLEGNRRASLRDRRASADRDIRSFWRLAREAVANNV